MNADEIFVLILVLVCVAVVVAINRHSKRLQQTRPPDVATPSTPEAPEPSDLFASGKTRIVLDAEDLRD